MQSICENNTPLVLSNSHVNLILYAGDGFI